MKTRLSAVAMFLCVVTTGCGGKFEPLHEVSAKPADVPVLGERFAPESTGVVAGRLVWHGALPEMNAYQAAKVGALNDSALPERLNAALPIVNPSDRGVADAVIFLARVDPGWSKVWDLPPARVEAADKLVRVSQRNVSSRVGFVHRGDRVAFNSRNVEPEMIRARGAASFTLPFQSISQSIERPMDQKGLLEISSAAGNYCARAWLFVVEHPYYCTTDEHGNFRLEHVPEGTYELVCWMPNWHVARFDRDPEILNVSRVELQPPVQRRMQIVVHRSETTGVEFKTGLRDFEPQLPK